MRLLTALVLALSIGSTGCIKKMLTEGQIKSTRKGSSAFQTIGDYELARSAASAGLVQFEGMHELAPDNTDALYLLVRGWVGYGYAFPQDDMETAMLAGNDELADYHKQRAKMAYERAIHYGLEALSHNDEGFPVAKKNADTIKTWLAKHFTSQEDGELLFWTGYGWLARTNLLKDDPSVVADLFIGVAMLERAMAIDPAYNNYGAYSALGSYHARNSVAEVDQARQMFETALAKTGRKALLTQVAYAERYACVKGDRALYEKLLNEVLNAGDPDPQQRLTNAVAKRRAKRALSRDKMMDCGFDMSEPKAPAAPKT